MSYVLWILGAYVLWFACGFLGAALQFTYFLHAYPNIAERNYKKYVRYFIVDVFQGIVSLVLSLTSKKILKTAREAGIWYPCKKAHRKACKITRNLHTEFDRAFCERNGFVYEELREVLEQARAKGMPPRPPQNLTELPRPTIH